MIKILFLNLILFTTLSLVNCGGSAGAPTDPPSNDTPQNQTDLTNAPSNNDSNMVQDNNNKPLSDYKGVSGGLAILHTDDYLFTGTWEISIVFDSSWNGSKTHTAADFSNIIIYINDTPHPVSVVEMIQYNDNELGLFFVDGAPDATIKAVEDAGFSQHPATYRVSLIIHGVELTADEMGGFYVDANRNFVAQPFIAP
ncbi:MAG: hypothetical protein FWD44_00360 [Oscillospiraceae bacterium]|nr:hypothetical protein [Oscillospiraceae bacterium]